MKDYEIEQYLLQILENKVPPPIREVARKFNLHNFAIHRKFPELTEKITQKRRDSFKVRYLSKGSVNSDACLAITCLRCPKLFIPKNRFNKLCPGCIDYIKTLA